MQVALSIAVILVALSAAAPDSAETEPASSGTFQQGEQKIFDHVGEKAKEFLHELQYSSFANRTRDWFAGHIQKIKTKLEDVFSTHGSD